MTRLIISLLVALSCLSSSALATVGTLSHELHFSGDDAPLQRAYTVTVPAGLHYRGQIRNMRW